MKRQRSTLEKRNALEEGKNGDAVGRPSRRSSLLGDPGEKFLGGKLKSSLNSVSTCLKVVDTRRNRLAIRAARFCTRSRLSTTRVNGKQTSMTLKNEGPLRGQ
jgi:hypothetical protein